MPKRECLERLGEEGVVIYLRKAARSHFRQSQDLGDVSMSGLKTQEVFAFVVTPELGGQNMTAMLITLYSVTAKLLSCFHKAPVVLLACPKEKNTRGMVCTLNGSSAEKHEGIKAQLYRTLLKCLSKSVHYNLQITVVSVKFESLAC